MGIVVSVLTNMSQVSLELVDRGSDESGSTVPLDFDDEYIGVITVFELNTPVDGMAAPAQVFANRTGSLQVGDMPEQVTDGVQGGGRQVVYWR